MIITASAGHGLNDNYLSGHYHEIVKKNLTHFYYVVSGLYLQQMISKENKYNNILIGRSVLAIIMIFLLLFLTTVNYFLFQDKDSTDSVSMMVNQEDDSEAFPGSPSGPDEKSPGGPVSISEEFLHGHIDVCDFFLTNQLFTHLIAASEKIEMVHFELLSPPPEC